MSWFILRLVLSLAAMALGGLAGLLLGRGEAAVPGIFVGGSVAVAAIAVFDRLRGYRLLHFFLSHPERVHSRTQLLDKVWGDHVFIEERTIDVHVKRLREALTPVRCAHLIETVRGAGYRLTLSAKAVSE